MTETGQMTLGFLIADLARQQRTVFERRVRGLGYTRAQWQTLSFLSRNEGINQAGLADVLEVEPITLSRLLDRMEEAGLVERRPDPQDRRARRLYMTPLAHKAKAELGKRSEAMQVEVTQGFTAEEVTTLRGLLVRLRENVAALAAET